jgi:SecD/SecF fusion protein
VIVFDRIRENVPRMPRATFSQIANRSMSEVFTRSLATSFVVLMPVGSLLLFGGETLKDFAFALLVGVISGAYSSIFIATPVLVEWKEREQTYMRRRRLMFQDHAGHIPAFAPGALGEPAVAAAPAAPAAARAPAPAQTVSPQAATAPPAERSERQARRQRRAAAGGSRSTTAPQRPAEPPPERPAAPPPERPAAPPPAPPPERVAEPSAETPASPSAPTAPVGDGSKPKPKAKSKRQQKRRKHGRR